MTLNDCLKPINDELAHAGYKLEEAFATIWPNGKKIEVKGRKANAIVELIDGCPKITKCSFLMLRSTIDKALGGMLENSFSAPPAPYGE